MSNTITRGEQTAAREEAYKIIDHIRATAFRDGGGERYTDGQLWQAIKDSRDDGRTVDPHAVAITLLDHIINGRRTPEAAYLPNREGRSDAS